MQDKRLFEVIDTDDAMVRGDPPEICNEDYDYVSYFENKNGDHLLFMYDADEGEGVLYNSKAGWEEKSVISAEEIKEGDFHIHYDQEEGAAKWLHGVTLALQPRMKQVGYNR